MRVSVLFMSLVTCISGHTWYRGPTHFFVDVQTPLSNTRPFIEGTSIGSLGLVDSVGGQSAGLASFDPSVEPVSFASHASSSLDFAAARLRPRERIPPSLDQSFESASLAMPSASSLAFPADAALASAERFPVDFADTRRLVPSDSLALAGRFTGFSEAQRFFPGGLSENQRLASADSLASAERFSAGFPDAQRFFPSDFAGAQSLSHSDFAGAQSLSHSGLIDPRAATGNAENFFGFLGQSSAAGKAASFVGKESLPLGVSASTGFQYRYVPSASNNGIKWFDGASKFLHYYQNQHRYGFQPHIQFRNLEYNKEGKNLVPPY